MATHVRDSDGQRRLLVITYHFPPDGSVGGLRWAGMSKYLARRGWEVHVVTASAQGASVPVRGVEVHHRARYRTLDDVYNTWIRRIRASSGHAAKPSAPAMAQAGERPTGAAGWIRNNLAMALAFPDHGRGWITPATLTVRRLLRERRFDAVITSGPPHSAHLVGALACSGVSVPLWVDMRDPWAGLLEAAWAKTIFSSAASRFLVRRLERAVLRRAHRVVTNTAEFADVLRGSYPELRVSYVPNGIDSERLPPAAVEKFDGLAIAYVGSLYAGRDLSSVLRAMRAFLTRQPDALGALKLRIAGGMDAAHEAQFRRDVAATDLGDVVETLGQVSNTEALDLVNRSHLTLVLAQNQPMQVPAKLYECVAMGIPTLVITESTSAAAREASRIGAMVYEAADVEGICAAIQRLWRDRTPAVAPASSLDYDDISAQLDALLLGAPARPDTAARRAARSTLEPDTTRR